MKTLSQKVRLALGAALVLMAQFSNLHAAPVIRAGAGMSPGDIQALLDLFELDLGGSGYSTLDWDSTDDAAAAPAQAPSFFPVIDLGNGVAEFSTPGSGFEISADSSNPTTTPTGFGNVDPSYTGLFQTFSSERLFRAVDSTTIDVTFKEPGSTETATITGFGVVFSGVDAFDSTSIEFFDADNNSLTTVFAPPSPAGGLSFLGVSFDSGQTVGRVVIQSGNAPLANGVSDGPATDLVVIDDILFSNPTSVPEPSTFALLGLGTLALLALRRKASTPRS